MCQDESQPRPRGRNICGTGATTWTLSNACCMLFKQIMSLDWENWGTEKLRSFSEVTQLRSDWMDKVSGGSYRKLCKSLWCQTKRLWMPGLGDQWVQLLRYSLYILLLKRFNESILIKFSHISQWFGKSWKSRLLWQKWKWSTAIIYLTT